MTVTVSADRSGKAHQLAPEALTENLTNSRNKLLESAQMAVDGDLKTAKTAGSPIRTKSSVQSWSTAPKFNNSHLFCFLSRFGISPDSSVAILFGYTRKWEAALCT